MPALPIVLASIFLGIQDRVHIVSMAGYDFRSVLPAVTRLDVAEVDNLAGETSVELSFDQPVDAIESIAMGTLNRLEAIRCTGKPVRLFC